MRRKYFRSKRESLKRLPEVTLTPLIDTALTLLIIFMITTPMIHNAINVNLPKGQAKDDVATHDEIIVYIDEAEKLYLDRDEHANGVELISALKKVVGDDKDRVVYIKADRAVRYGTVLELVDQMKVVGGISRVALPTRKA